MRERERETEKVKKNEKELFWLTVNKKTRQLLLLINNTL